MGLSPRAPGPEEDVESLLDLVGACGRPAEGMAKARLCYLAEAIIRWNEAINLVSRKDIGRLTSYHFCDSASVVPIVGWRSGLRVLDVGGSNGLPGLVLAALIPEIRLTICDARQKRRGFLEEVCGSPEANKRQVSGPETPSPEGRSRRLTGGAHEPVFDNALFEMERADSEAFQERHREGFDLILARAVTQMKLLVRWCMPLLGSGGRLVAYKGSQCADELRRAEVEVFGHGGAMAAVAASPWANACNPLRLFAIVQKG